MAHSTHKDPMAKPVLIGGLALIGTTIFVLVSNLFSTIDRNSTKGAEDTSMAAAAADINLAPIGSVVTVDKSIVKEARSGEAVYNAVCTSCHAAGVLGAPKLDDKGAWEPRVAQTLKVLLDHATNGIRSMPARGGDPTITDEELVNTIVYMTGKAGFDLSADAKGQVPGSAAPAAAEQAAAPAEAPAAEQAAVAPAEQAAAPVAAAAIDGEKIYKGICFSCHDVGIAGSPKLGDKAAWAPRIATGNDAMYHNAINGKNVMPAKGGNPALSDDEVKAAVDFMVGKSQ